MKIILSPAKKMKVDTDYLAYQGLPVFLEQTEGILSRMREKTYSELKEADKRSSGDKEVQSIGIYIPGNVVL